ncbi:MAG TPA: phage tail tape measure protein, partial [Symbiobacteriaceae bacterium]|nr:phage tail tape measure protein [Symbiobacteriaceae bacterium]
MATLADLLVKIRGDASDFEKKMGSIEKKWTKFGDQLQNVGTRLTTGITLPLAVMGGGALKASIDFETAFAGVRKTVNGTEDDLAGLEQGLRDMAKTVPQSAVELAGIAEAAGQLGIETDSILGFTKVIADLGVSSNLAGEEAATMLARFANITQMPQDEFDRLGATIVALGNAGASTEAEIMEMGLRIAGAGNQVGMSESQILAFANALSSVGIEAEAGGSAISRVMIDIATSVANGDEKLSQFAEVAGMTSEQFKTAFKDDAAGALTTFIEGLGRMQTEGANVFGTLDELGLSEIRVRDALLRAAGAGDLFRDSLNLGSEAWAANTALTNEANQRYGTTASQLGILWNQLKDMAITMGDAVAPAMMAATAAAEPLMNALEGMAQWFANLDTGTQQWILGAVALVAALGPILYIVGTVTKAVSGLVGVVKLLGSALSFLAANPVVLIIAAVAALVAGLIYLWNTHEGFRNAVIAVWEAIKGALLAVWDAVGPYLMDMWNSLVETARALFDGLRLFWEEWGGTIQVFFQGLWDAIMLVINTVFNAIRVFWEDWGGAITTFFSATWNQIKLVFDTALNLIKDVFGLVMAVLRGDWEEAWERIKSIGETIWNAITGTLQNFARILGGIWEGILNTVDRVWDGIVGLIKGAVNGIIKMINGMIRALNAIKISFPDWVPGLGGKSFG